MRLLKFIKDWILIFSILSGVAGYFLCHAAHLCTTTHNLILRSVETVQPLLIFSMLFLTFCKVDPRQLRLCRYHWWLLAFQCAMFVGLGGVLAALPHSDMRIVLEGGMICFICPTATAGAVVTRKLGGNAQHIITYTMLINLFAALLIPAVVPFVHPNPLMSHWNAFALILAKVFPLLLLPLLTAFLIRRFLPYIHRRITAVRDLAFYLWVVALALAMAVTTRHIVHSHVTMEVQLWLVAVSFASCGIQFWLGRKIGGYYDEKITGGQSLGQKNTVLAIWLGYTFFTPITSVAGGFYSIWHNVVNSYQLYLHGKHSGKEGEE